MNDQNPVQQSSPALDATPAVEGRADPAGPPAPSSKAKECPKPPVRPSTPAADVRDDAANENAPAGTADTGIVQSALKPMGSGQPGQPVATTPAQQQLERLRAALEAGQKEILKFEPLKNSLTDLAARIESLEKSVAAQPAASAAYAAFYNAVERYRSEIDCSIPTVRCQLELTEKARNCVRHAIACVDARIHKAQADRDAQNAEVARRTARQKVLEADLEWAAKWNDFFATDLQAQVTRQREDLKALNQLADPAKDQCEVWFYLTEMEAILRSGRTGADGYACYLHDINIATFLDCWSPKCYADACQHWIVAFNDADAAEKRGKAELGEAVKHAAELEKAAAEAMAKRREWILQEIKTQGCCGSTSKCA